jgi:Domain of unknown function (DUF222)
MGRSVLASGELGKHNGLPCTIIVSTTLQELESGQGHAVTGGGSLLPMSDVIRVASANHHYLAIFDKHTQEPLVSWLCQTAGFSGAADCGARQGPRVRPARLHRARVLVCQTHHVDGWDAEDIDKLTLACGPDNRLVEEGGWTTRKHKDGRTEWIPPPHQDSGQARINDTTIPRGIW